ncbi:hypothetical protein Tco_1368428 [Tanacetum coccineum]
MIDLSKKKRTTDQFILVRRDQTPHDSTTGPSSQPEEDTDNFGDQFLYDKPTEDDQEKSKVVYESDDSTTWTLLSTWKMYTSEKVIHESSSTSGFRDERQRSETELLCLLKNTLTHDAKTEVKTKAEEEAVAREVHATHARIMSGPDPEPMQENQTGSNSRKLHVSLAGPNPEHIDDELTEAEEAVAREVHATHARIVSGPDWIKL